MLFEYMLKGVTSLIDSWLSKTMRKGGKRREREKRKNFSHKFYLDLHVDNAVAVPSGHYYKAESHCKRPDEPEEDKYRRKNPVIAMKRWFRLVFTAI